MNKFIDIHCHPDFPITIRPTGNVSAIVCNSSTPDDWDKIITDCDTYPDFCYGAIGVHPWYATDATPNWESNLHDKLIQNPKLMIGEIGLDKHHPNMITQVHIFTTQMKIAHDLHRPAQIHCVGAWNHILHTLTTNKTTLPPIIIMHDYNANAEITEQLLKYENIYFSFSPRIIPTSNKHDTIIAIPAHRLLVESDSETPGDIHHVLKHLGAVRETPFDTLCTQIYNNSITVINNE